MGNIQFPCVMFAAELHTLSEDLFNLLVVFCFPVDPSLSHQHRDIAVGGGGGRAEGDGDGGE